MPIAYEVLSTIDATIANTATTSAAIAIGAGSVVGIVCPATLPSITTLTFQVALTSGGTYQPLYDSNGTQVSVPVAAGRSISVDLTVFAAWPFVKLVGNVAATADRVFTLVVRPL